MINSLMCRYINKLFFVFIIELFVHKISYHIYKITNNKLYIYNYVYVYILQLVLYYIFLFYF